MTAAVAMSTPLLDAHLQPDQLELLETDRRRPPASAWRRWRTRATTGALNRPLVRELAATGLLDRLFQHDDEGWRADVGAMELCLIREGLARHCTEAETAFAVQGLGSFPLLQSGPPGRDRRLGPPARDGRGGRRLRPDRAGLRQRRRGARARGHAGRRGLPAVRREDLHLQRARRRRLLRLRPHDGGRRRPRGHGLLGPARLARPHRRAASSSSRRIPSAGSSSRTSTCRRSTSWARSTAASASRCARWTSSAPASARSPSGWRRPRSPPPATTPPRAHAFGKPLKDFQAVSHRLADVATRLQAARLLVHHAATAYDGGIRPVTQTAAMAKLLATEVAQEAVDVADPDPRREGARARAPPRAPLPRGAGAADLRGRLGDPARDHRPGAVRLRRTGGRDEGRHHRRRPRRPVRRDPLQPARPGERGHRLGAQRAGRHVRLRRRLLRRDAHRLRGRRPADVRARSRAASPAGPTSTSTTAASVAALRRSRLLGARPASTC